MRRYAGRTMIAGKLMAACVAASGLWSEGAHAQSAAPDVVVPTISCTTPPAIFNTGINGDITNNASYATASKITPSNGTKYDQHWQMTPQLKPFDPATQTYQTFFNDPASVNWTGKSAPVYYYSTAWLASPFGNAEWIGLNHTPGTSGPYYETSIYYKYTFNLDSAVIPSSFSLKLRGSSDDYFKEVYVNYVPQLNLYPLPENANTGVATFSSTNYANIFLNKNWQAGQNTIIVRIKNQSAPTGFLMQTDGTAACANEVQVKKTTTSTVVKPGDPITFDLAVGNYSTIDRTINLTDQIPQGLTNYSWSCSAVNSIPAATCPVPANGTGAINNLPLTIAAGGTLKFTITTTVGTPAQITTPTITNTATITTPTLPTDTANICTPSTCSASATVKTTPLVNITKTPVAGQNSNHYPGDVVAYNLTVTNMGQIALKNITLSDVHTTNASFVPTTGMT